MTDNNRDRLDPDQKEVWDVMKPHLGEAYGENSREQAINFGILSFLYWCDLDGYWPLPTEDAIRTEFEEAGVPERFPGSEYWEFLRRNPGHWWILDRATRAQGAGRRRSR